MYTIEQVCTMLNIHQNSLYKWIKQGKVNAVKVGKVYRISEEEIDRIKREGING